MRLYLPGPPGPDQIATKCELRARGYDVTCSSDVERDAYRCYSTMPFMERFQKLQMQEMLAAKAVLVPEDISDAAAISLLNVCSFIATPLVATDSLPLWSNDRNSLDHLDLTASPELVSKWWESRTGRAPVIAYKLPDQKPPTTA